MHLKYLVSILFFLHPEAHQGTVTHYVLLENINPQTLSPSFCEFAVAPEVFWGTILKVIRHCV